MTDLAGKMPAMANVPADVKAQFDAAQQGVRDGAREVRRRRRAAAPPAAWRRRRRWTRRRRARRTRTTCSARAGTVKTQILAFYDMPSDSLVRGYNDVKVAMPKAIAEANAFLIKATALSHVAEEVRT